MTKNKLRQSDSDDLRIRAEERLGENTVTAPQGRTTEEPLRLLHELQVHQLELEMQNAELLQTRSELESTLDKFTDLYDFAPVGYVTLDRNGTIIGINHAGSGFLGVERSRLSGRRFEQFLAVTTRPVFADLLGKVFSNLSKESCEVELVNRGDSALILQIVALVANSGEECRIALIDITEQKKAEEVISKLNTKLSKRTAELEDANNALTAFNYTVSHDLRRPLNNIYTSSQAIELLCRDKLDEECKKLLVVVKNGVMSMSKLISTLLRFSHSGLAEIYRKKVDLSTMARVICADLRVKEPGKRATFKIEEGVVVNGDPDLIRVVLENLFENAWKYTSDLEEAIIEFGTREIGGIQTYFIRDNGLGFDNQAAEGLFHPFRRFSESKMPGHGIGLATVERIIRRHGGKIWGDGEPGKGATFYFTM